MSKPQFLALLGLTVLILQFGANQGGREIVTERILLKDARGTARAELATTQDGVCALLLKDSDGRNRLKLAVDGDGVASVRCLDKKSNDRVGMGVDSGGSPFVYVNEASGVCRILLICEDKDRLANLTLFDDKGAHKVGMSAWKDGANLGFAVKDQGSGLVLGVTSTNGPVLEVYGSERKRRIYLGTGHEGAVGLFIHGPDGKDLIQLGSKPSGSLLIKLLEESDDAKGGPGGDGRAGK